MKATKVNQREMKFPQRKISEGIEILWFGELRSKLWRLPNPNNLAITEPGTLGNNYLIRKDLFSIN